jgi:hypothetical protein
MLRRMMRGFGRPILAVLGLAILGGCSSGALVDKLPGEMAEPADTPARPVTPYVFPAVHDIPPPRATPTMTEDQQIKLEKDLAVARDRQETREKTAAAPAKKKQPAAPPGAAADAQDGAKTKP